MIVPGNLGLVTYHGHNGNWKHRVLSVVVKVMFFDRSFFENCELFKQALENNYSNNVTV